MWRLCTLLVFFLLPSLLPAAPKGRIDLEQKLGEKLPLELTFSNEKGEKVTLRSLMGKPTILALVYYSCPGICTPLLNDLKRELERMQLEPGRDFQVVTVSFDPREGPDLARKKKRSYLQQMRRPFPEEAWHFLTGTEESIRQLTQKVGFHFRKEGDVYRHPGGLIILSPTGKICRYIYGAEFLAVDLEMALRKAAQEIVEPAIPKVVTPKTKLFCFVVDAEGKIVGLHITNTLMIVIFLTVSLFGGYMFWTTVWQEWKKGEEHAHLKSRP